MQQRRTDAIAHRAEIGARLAAGCGAEWVEIPVDVSFERRAEYTRHALDAGAAFVWRAVLPPAHPGSGWGLVDLLIRTDGGYLPVLVVRHRITDPGAGAMTTPITELRPSRAAPDPARKARSQTRDQLRLAHLTRMLHTAGVSPPGAAVGGVIGLDADVVLWHDLSAPSWPGGRSTMIEYGERFADRLAVATAAASGAPALAEPSRITECRYCPWWPTCEVALTARQDVSLVLRGEPAVALRSAGVATVADLAALDPAGPPPVPITAVPFADAVALARAWVRGLSVVRRVPRVAVPRADVEVDIDMESFGESGAYLWGCLLSGVDIGQSAGYRAFSTWQPVPTDDEARSFAEFWVWLSDVRRRAAERGLSFAAFCYNEHAENRWLLSSAGRFVGYPGVPTTREVLAFIESSQWVDLFAVVSDWFLCAQGKGLKRIAPVAGFAWQDPEAGGENSMRWYRDAVGMSEAPPALAAAQRERLLAYNADDVHATRALREWMSSPAVEQVPLAADL